MGLRWIAAVTALCCAMALPAMAGNSFLLSDGVNRAPAITLHCVGPGGSAIPCGVASQPLIVAPTAGGATAPNQATQILSQQAMVQSLGTPADPAYVSGTGSIVALLKGIFAGGTSSSVVAGGVPISRSLPVGAQQSVQLFAANPARKYLAFQAPAGSFIWVNFLGGTAAPNGLDCAYFTAGTLYESGPFVNRGAITVYSPVGAAISAWED